MLITIATNILWIAIGIILLGLAVYLLLRVITLWFPLPERVEQAIWLIFGILCLIAILTALGGGGMSVPFHYQR